MSSVAAVVCFGWILSVCLHEFGHAVVAYWGGDTSVKDKGYLTLNPLKYTNLDLSLTLPIIFLLMGGIALPGGAVYINRQQLRGRWWQSAVSAAGPIASILVTLLLAIPFSLGLASLDGDLGWFWSALAFLIFLEIYSVLINSLPIPPLDGYGMIEPWLSPEIQAQLRKFGKSGIYFLFMLLWFAKPINLFLGNLAASIAQVLGVPGHLQAEGFMLFCKSSSILLVAGVILLLLVRKGLQRQHEV
ncbi:MAG: site-2 protease family protein [Chroococcidiopsidaceae cyanobacterium CP_BM_RX_35]|nr:site-2 protease family protein [Chroococcidiopsidaceae cyanobacterium CP_BM_RX_35]